MESNQTLNGCRGTAGAPKPTVMPPPPSKREASRQREREKLAEKPTKGMRVPQPVLRQSLDAPTSAVELQEEGFGQGQRPEGAHSGGEAGLGSRGKHLVGLRGPFPGPT